MLTTVTLCCRFWVFFRSSDVVPRRPENGQLLNAIASCFPCVMLLSAALLSNTVVRMSV